MPVNFYTKAASQWSNPAPAETVGGSAGQPKIKSVALVLFCLITAFLILILCSKSSFLYPLNDWVDANCFFTVGKSMFHGKILYRDIMEQKGPLLYFIHGLASLLSFDSFIGVFCFELLAATAFLLLSFKTLRLYAPEALSVIFLPITAALIYSSPAFCHGDSAEELCLPLLAYSVYTLLRFLKTGALKKPLLTFTVNGFLCGCVFFVKYTLLGPFIAFGLTLFSLGVVRKNWPFLINLVCGFTLGLILSALPWLLYFALSGSVSDFIRVYLYDNIFSYAESPGLLAVFLSLGKFVRDNFGYALIIMAGSLYTLFSRYAEASPPEKIGLLFMEVLTCVLIFIGGRDYPYYGLVLSVFLTPCAGAFLSLLHNINTSEFLRKRVKALCALTLLLSVLAAYFLTPNRYLMGVDKNAMPQYQFAQIIDRKSNPTLLNYGFLDGGFYTAAKVVPNCKYFCTLNVNLPEAEAVQLFAIENGQFDFLITRNKMLDSSYLGEYRLIDTANFCFEGSNYIYYLYGRNT